MEKTEKTTDAPERAQLPGPAAELWRMSPMTRAVVDEVRAVLRRGHTSTRAHEHTDASAGNSTHDAHDRKGGRSPAERQRPPAAVAPTSAGGGGEDHRGATRKSPTKASRARAAAAAAAGAGAGAHARGGAVPATPSVPEETFAQPRARLRRLRLRKTPRGCARGGRGGGGGGRRRRAALDGPPGVSRGGSRPRRVRCFSAFLGPARARARASLRPVLGRRRPFYFDASSETGSEARSERAACEARTVRQALGVPETESPPRGRLARRRDARARAPGRRHDRVRRRDGARGAFRGRFRNPRRGFAAATNESLRVRARARRRREPPGDHRREDGARRRLRRARRRAAVAACARAPRVAGRGGGEGAGRRRRRRRRRARETRRGGDRRGTARGRRRPAPPRSVRAANGRVAPSDHERDRERSRRGPKAFKAFGERQPDEKAGKRRRKEKARPDAAVSRARRRARGGGGGGRRARGRRARRRRRRCRAVPENPENPDPPLAEGTPTPSEDERTPIVTPTETPREDPEDPKTRRANREAFGLKRRRRSSIPRGASA